MLLYYDEETRKRYARRLLFSAVSVFVIVAVSNVIINAVNSSKKSDDGETTNSGSSSFQVEDNSPTQTDGESPKEQPDSSNKTESPKSPEKPIPSVSPEPQPTLPLYTVTHVVDGDTIDINYEGVITRIRLIGIDTPETKDSRKPVECYGPEASSQLTSLLYGKQVSIEADATQDNVDVYGRLLRYVYLNGQDVGLSMIAGGYAHEYTFNKPYLKQSEYKTAEYNAMIKGVGLWSSRTCNVDLEDEAYSAGIYDHEYGYYGASFDYDDDCDAACRDILEDAYDEGWYDAHY